MLKPKLPPDDCSLVIRTDFSDEAAWQRVASAIQAHHAENQLSADVELISDQSCAGLTPSEVCELVPGVPDLRLFLFIVDSQTIIHPEHPILVVDTEDTDMSFRVVPSAAWEVEPNLRLANMGFDDFQMGLGADGIYRGSAPRPQGR
jgi:hypothetical protein